MHLVYKTCIWSAKLAFRLQIFTFQFTNKHLGLQTGTSDYNSASERLVFLRQLAVKQMQTLAAISMDNLPQLPDGGKKD